MNETVHFWDADNSILRSIVTSTMDKHVAQKSINYVHVVLQVAFMYS